ncbi:MYB-like protein, partial [Metarhizium majus ARSEF 297]
MGEESDVSHHAATGDGELLEVDTSCSTKSVDGDVAVPFTDESTGTTNGSTTDDDSASACEKDRQTTACKKNCLKKGKQCLKAAPEVASTNSSDVSASIVASSQTSNSNDTKPSCKKNKAKNKNSGISSKSDASSESNATTVDTGFGPETSHETGSAVDTVDSSSRTQEADSKANGNADTEGNDQSEWTVSEDLRLRGMKESTDNLSWADIGKALNRGKAEVKARWKAIKDQQPQEYATDTDADTKGDLGAGQSPDAKAEQGKEASSQPSKKQTINQRRLEHQKDHRNRRVAQENKGVKLGTCEAQYNEDNLSGSETLSESLCTTDERRRQRRYLYTHVYKTLYPAEADVGQNEHLTKRDRAVLATIACMHTTNKLLEMKANFMNATGADVPIAVLRDWYEGEWAAKEDRPNAVQHEDSVERVEKWIDSVSMGAED